MEKVPYNQELMNMVGGTIVTHIDELATKLGNRVHSPLDATMQIFEAGQISVFAAMADVMARIEKGEEEHNPVDSFNLVTAFRRTITTETGKFSDMVEDMEKQRLKLIQ